MAERSEYLRMTGEIRVPRTGQFDNPAGELGRRPQPGTSMPPRHPTDPVVLCGDGSGQSALR